MKAGNITLCQLKYYIPHKWPGSCTKVQVIKILNEQWAIVKNRKGDKFHWHTEFIYSSDQAAIKGHYAYFKKLKAEKAAKKEARATRRMDEKQGSMADNKDTTTNEVPPLHNPPQGIRDFINDTPCYYAIHSLSMTNFLVRSGFNIVKVSDSDNNPKLKIFLFHDSIALRNTMANFKRQGE